MQHDIPGLSYTRDSPLRVSTGQDDHRAHALLVRRSSREIVPYSTDHRREAIQNKKVVMSILSASKNDKTVT